MYVSFAVYTAVTGSMYYYLSIVNHTICGVMEVFSPFCFQRAFDITLLHVHFHPSLLCVHHPPCMTFTLPQSVNHALASHRLNPGITMYMYLTSMGGVKGQQV